MNSFRRKTLLAVTCCALLAFAGTVWADSPRELINSDDNWKFLQGDPADAFTAGFNDSTWRAVTLPHDWSIEGKIAPNAPTGGTGGFFPCGVAWYRHRIDAPASWKEKRVRVEFEGVYMNADVYLNGQKLTFHPYGYTSFFVDLTPALKVGEANLLAVRVDNSHQKNSRWYSGAGIYRHVWLHVTNPVQVAPWGVFVTVSKADASAATLLLKTKVLNQTNTAKIGKVETVLIGPDGKELGHTESPVTLPASEKRRSARVLHL